MSEQESFTPCWRVTWKLNIFQESEEIPILNAPDVNSFRIRFPSKEAAVLFKVEMQRWIGDGAIKLAYTARNQ